MSTNFLHIIIVCQVCIKCVLYLYYLWDISDDACTYALCLHLCKKLDESLFKWTFLQILLDSLSLKIRKFPSAIPIPEVITPVLRSPFTSLKTSSKDLNQTCPDVRGCGAASFSSSLSSSSFFSPRHRSSSSYVSCRECLSPRPPRPAREFPQAGSSVSCAFCVSAARAVGSWSGTALAKDRDATGKQPAKNTYKK